MTEFGVINESSSISDSDIVFECSSCGKSLAIDRRGAGMAISCPDCGQELIVPPPGHAMQGALVELTVDQRIDALSNALQESHSDIRRLSTHVTEVTKRRKYLEHVRAENIKRMERIAEELTVLQSVIDRIASILQDSAAVENDVM